MSGAGLWWKGFVEKVSLSLEWKRVGVMDALRAVMIGEMSLHGWEPWDEKCVRHNAR